MGMNDLEGNDPGPMPVTRVQQAYGALWRCLKSTEPQVHEARRLLREVLTFEERKAGVEWAIKAFGPVSDMEAAAMDMQAGEFPKKSTN